MFDLEPFIHWRDVYAAEEDAQSPFFGRRYSPGHRIYNYLIHPQWDDFGSTTLYTKLLYVDYREGTAILEMLGEWNDCLHNDVMFLKRELVDHLQAYGIHKYVLIGEHVLNFHASDDCYYEEWNEDVREEDGWVVFLNLRSHVADEMRLAQIHHYVHFGKRFQLEDWRTYRPKVLMERISAVVEGRSPFLPKPNEL
jgi:hypothetical protein